MTGISIYYHENGNVVIPNSALEIFNEIISNVSSQYWVNRSSDPQTGMGSNDYNIAVEKMNSLLPLNFLFKIKVLGQWGNSLIPTISGKCAANIAIQFIDSNGQNANNIVLENNPYNGITTSWYNGNNFLIILEMLTNVDCLYFTTDIINQIIPMIQDFTSKNWTINSTDPSQGMPNMQELVNELNTIFPIMPNLNATVVSFGKWVNVFENVDGVNYVQFAISFTQEYYFGIDPSYKGDASIGGWAGISYLIVRSPVAYK